MADDDLKNRVSALEQRVNRTSERARAMRTDMSRSITDAEERYTDFERAVMEHVRRIEAQNNRQTHMLEVARVATPIAVAVTGGVTSLVHAVLGGSTMMNMSTVLMWLGAIYGIVTGLSFVFTFVAKLAPSVPAFGKIASVLGAFALDVQKLVNALGGGGTTPSPSDQSKRGFIRIDVMVSIAALGVLVFACKALAPAVPTTEQCVSIALADAANGATFAQILEDPKIAGCTTVDLLVVLESLLNSKDPKVMASRAYAEAVKVEVAMAARKAAAK